MICILYIIAFSAGLTVAALLLDAALPPAWPRRWLWLGMILLAVTIPPVYQARHFTVVHSTRTLDAMSSVVLTGWAYTTILLFLLAAAYIARAWRISSRARRAAGTIDGVQFRITDAVGPATFGILKAHVLVPRWVLRLPERQRRFVLKHEDEHRRARDAQLMLLAALPLIVTPWNVVAWWQARRFALAIETDCDRRVVNALGDAHDYSATLVDIAAGHGRDPQIQPALLGGMLEQRIRNLLRPAERSVMWRIVLGTAAVAIGALVLAAPHPVSAAHAALHR